MRKLYIRKMQGNWWLTRRAYILFMVRELTAVFVGASAVLLLVGIWCFSEGAEPFNNFMELLQRPYFKAFHIVAFAAAVFHTCTWFNVTPKVLVVRIGENRVPGALIAAGHYAMWLAVSAVTAWLILR